LSSENETEINISEKETENLTSSFEIHIFSKDLRTIDYTHRLFTLHLTTQDDEIFNETANRQTKPSQSNVCYICICVSWHIEGKICTN